MNSRIFLFTCSLFSAMSMAQPQRLDMAEVVKLLAAQGYHDIREVELNGDQFEIKTLDGKEQKVHLVIDAYSGEIKQKKAD